MNKFLWVGLLCVLCMQCTDSKEAVETLPINNSWYRKYEPTFTIEANDTAAKDIFLMVRNNDDYPYSNIRFIVTLQKEKEKPITVDTLNFTLARPDGSWLGKGFGKVKESELLYKSKFSFPSTGKYTMTVAQAMRKDSLKGIEDIGYRIETSKP